MRGSKHGDEIRERAFALLASGESVSATAKALQLSYTTVKTWERAWSKKAVVKARQGNADECAKSSGKSENTRAETTEISDSDIDEVTNTSSGEDEVTNTPTGKDEKTLDELREEMKREFVRRSCRMIQDTQTLIERRIQRAVHKEDVLDELISMVETKENLTYEERKKIVDKISGLRLDDIRALSSILATLWDKQALAMKEPTANVDGSFYVKFEDYE